MGCREASVALNAWQPEVVRGRHKQILEQCAVPVEYRMHALEMELRLCKHRISGFRRGLVSFGHLSLIFCLVGLWCICVCDVVWAQQDEKPRLDTAKQQLLSLNYHPLRGDYVGFSGGDDQSNMKRKKKNP